MTAKPKRRETGLRKPGRAPKEKRSDKPSNKNALRLIQLADSPDGKTLEAMAGGAWNPVDRKAKEEIARRRPSAELVKRAGQCADILEKEFPQAVSALDYKTPLQLLIATILSAQCTDKRVNQVTPGLFKKYPTARDFAESPPGELEEAIRSTGFFNNKAKSIRACCRAIVEDHGGVVPRDMETLSSLPGVGRKTASVVRSNAFGLPGIAVDTHVQRVSRRLGLTDDTDPQRIEFDLGSLLPPERWSVFGHALILHGRKTCAARHPDCAGCPLQGLCPSAGTFDD